jgi:ABC-type multidrug transport system ATPase subunit
MTDAPAISLTDLTVTYRRGQIRALERIDLSLAGGMIGLLGPNGAGKTTLMRVLAGGLAPSSGTVAVGGADLADPEGRRATQARLGYLPQELGLYPELSAREFLDYVAILKGSGDRAVRRARVEETLELVGLGDAGHRRLKTFSGGMKRRVGIAQAIVNDPSLLIVDEPTAGLDPEERLRFRNLLAGLAGERTVLLSTHIVEDIAQTCLEVVVVDRGAIAFHGATSALAERAAGAVWLVSRPAGAPGPDLPVVTIAPAAGRVQYRVVCAGRPEPDAGPLEPTVEDGYVALMHGVGGSAGSGA